MMNISVLSWNIRGLGCEIKRDNIKRMVNKNNPGIVCLQETKIKVDNFLLRKSVGVWDPICWAEIHPSGLSGGLVSFWNPNLIQIEEIRGDRHWLWIMGRVKSSGERLHCCNVYAPLESRAKAQCWDELSRLIQLTAADMVVLIGDFNSVSSNEERVNCLYSSRDSEVFKEFIISNALLDVKSQNSLFTWCGPKSKKSRLDRALISPEWTEKGDWVVKVLDRKTSDHRAILLCNELVNWGSKPFKIFDIWLNNKDLLLKIEEQWKGDQNNVAAKLREVKRCIKDWNKNVNGDVNRHIEELEKKQFLLDELGNNEELANNTSLALCKLYEERASLLKQKSRIQWDLKGDENSKFFHRVVGRNWHKSKIMGIYWKDKWLQSAEHLKAAFLEYYKDFFRKKFDVPIFNLGSLIERRLSQEESLKMSSLFSMEELEEALNLSPLDKAPGPDGFSMGAMKKIWWLVKHELLECLNKFQKCGKLPGGMNSSFICLVPKCDAPQFIKEFRPISLINSSMKLLTKMLASRLSNVIGSLVSEVQTGFIKGRLITDGILIVSEVINSMKAGHCDGLILKLDFEKAFDSVDWSFLLQLLDKFNFSKDWIRWIKEILTTTRTSVLVNGSPTKEFSPERGLRQGDPLSPLLFDLVAQVLSYMISKAEYLGIIDGIKVTESSPVITHLQYADDTVIFIKSNSKSVMGIKSVLQGFQLLSGLKINFNKSSLYGIGQNQETLKGWADILGCEIGGDSFVYLGMEVLKPPNSVRYWDPLLNKVKKKLASWKSKSISMAGRTVLLKVVLDSLPIYWMSLQKVPKSVVQKIDTLRRSFLWDHTSASGSVTRKMHLVAWEKICSAKEDGGLGIKLTEQRNKALLLKWWHRCYTERDNLWNKVLKAKYGHNVWVNLGGVELCQSMSQSFKNICKVGCDVNNSGSTSQLFVWRVYNGEDVFFWEDVWAGPASLKSTYARIYSLSKYKWISISKMKDLWLRGELRQESAWLRKLRAWEEELWLRVEEVLEDLKLSSLKDQLIWSSSGKSYKVVDGYKSLFAPSNRDCIWTKIWKVRAPHKVRLLLWKIEHGVLSVKVFLKNRLHANNFNTMCGWCGKHDESIQHLLRDCELAKWVWEGIALWWQIPVRLFYSANFSIRSLFSLVVDAVLNKPWQSIVAAGLWYIWITRNNKVFNQKSISKDRLLAMIKVRAYQWLLASNLVEDNLWREWNASPQLVIQKFWLFKKNAIWNKLREQFEVICMVDGAFVNKNSAGIGGCIKDRSNNLLFLYFGPSKATSSHEAEWEAAIHMIKTITRDKKGWNSVGLCSDSKEVIQELQNFQDKKLWCELGWVEEDCIDLENFHFVHVGREFNLEADGLAKAGLVKDHIVEGWL